MKRDKQFLKTLFIVGFGVTLFWTLFNISNILGCVKWLMGILSPFILGVLLALILNVPMSAIERTLFKPDKDNKYGKVAGKIKRPVSLVITLVLCLGALLLAVALIVPEMIKTFDRLYNDLPELSERLTEQFNNSKALTKFFEKFGLDPDALSKKLKSLLENGELMLSTLSSTMSFASEMLSKLVNFVLGLVFAVYMLVQKETLKNQLYRITTAFVKDGAARRLCYVANMSKDIFSKFIAGQSVEALILGTLCCLGMLVFGFPNAFAVGVLVAVTSFIPIVGAFVGAAVGAFFIMFTSFSKALWFLLFILVLQQLEDNLIYPKIVGKSVGLPSIWVLFAITVGGAIDGVIGMFVAVPVCSVVYCLIREFVAYRHEKKRASEIPEAGPSEQQIPQSEE